MHTMCEEKLARAQTAFTERFSSRIEDLGFELAIGIGRKDGVLALAVWIRSPTSSPPAEGLQAQVRAMLGDTFAFEGESHPLTIDFSGSAIHYSDP